MEHPSVKYGLFGAVVAIIVSLLLWFVNPQFFLTWASWTGLLILIYFMYLAGKEARNLNEGFISFGEIFKYLFITVVVFTLVTAIFNFILYNFIDSGLMDLQIDIARENMEKIAESFGNEEMLDAMEEQLANQPTTYTPALAFQGWMVSIVMGAILSAIMGAIMKKKDPGFDEFA